MSDTPLTDAAYISGCYALHTSSEEGKFTRMLEHKLAAANKRIAQLESTLIDVQNYGQKRIAELETLLREVLRQGCEYHTKKYALLQMDHALIQEIADAIGVAREEEGK